MSIVQKTFSFVVSYTSGNNEIKGEKTFNLNEDNWKIDYVFKFPIVSTTLGFGNNACIQSTTSSSLNIHAKLTHVLIATLTTGPNLFSSKQGRKRGKACYCEIQIRYPNFINILCQSRKNLENDKFEYDMNIPNCSSLSNYEICLIFGYKSTINTSVFLSSMKKMQTEGTLTDFTIRTKEGEVPCHKVVLAARSDFFRNLFTTQMKEGEENVLLWEDVFDQTTVQDLLHFVYTEDTPPNIVKTCFTLLEVAHMCLIDVLKELCVDEIACQVNANNVVEVLQLGAKFDLEVLEKTATKFIVENLTSFNGGLKQLPGWVQMEGDMAKNVLASVFKIMAMK